MSGSAAGDALLALAFPSPLLSPLFLSPLLSPFAAAENTALGARRSPCSQRTLALVSESVYTRKE